MKKFKFLSVLLIASAMTLAGCNNTPAEGPTDGGDDTQEGGEGQGGGEQGGGEQGGGEQGGGEQGGGEQGGGGEQQASVVEFFFRNMDEFKNVGTNESVEFTTVSLGGLTLTGAAGTNQNPPKYYDSKGNGEDGKLVRFYSGNTLEISGAEFSKVEFDCAGVPSNKKEGTFEASSGSVSDTTWTGTSADVTFTIGLPDGATSAQKWIRKVTVTLTGEGGGSQGGGEGGEGGETSEYTPLYVINDFNTMIFADPDNPSVTEDGYAIYVAWGTKEDYPALTDALDELIADYSPEYVQYDEEYISDDEYGYYEDEATFVSTPAVVAVGIAGDVSIDAYAYYYTEDSVEYCGLDVYTYIAR